RRGNHTLTQILAVGARHLGLPPQSTKESHCRDAWESRRNPKTMNLLELGKTPASANRARSIRPLIVGGRDRRDERGQPAWPIDVPIVIRRWLGHWRNSGRRPRPVDRAHG